MQLIDSNRISDQICPVKVEISDIYSDFLFVTSQKEKLKIFADEISNTKSWTKESCYVIGNLYSLMQQHHKALTWFKRALMIDPEYEAALIISGNEYLELKSPSDAIFSYTAATSNFIKTNYFMFVELNPLNYRSFYSLASIYFLLDDLDQSIFFLKKAIKLE
jgi:anaphase-promoting complex subunit 8